MSKQYVARKSLTKGAAQAIRLNVQRTIAQSVLNSAFHLTAENAARRSIQSRHAVRDFGRGSLIVRRGEAFYLVESSRFAGRYYVVERCGCWLISLDEWRAQKHLVARVQAAFPVA
jgi:hypothetical protein